MRKPSKNIKETSNSSVYKKAHRCEMDGCPICPPHGGENQNRKPRRDKYKSRRKGRA